MYNILYQSPQPSFSISIFLRKGCGLDYNSLLFSIGFPGMYCFLYTESGPLVWHADIFQSER